jgi:hypothetical protein
MNEIDEFYSYVEMPQVAENLKAWKGSFPGGMQHPPSHVRIVYNLRIHRVDEPRYYSRTAEGPH